MLPPQSPLSPDDPLTPAIQAARIGNKQHARELFEDFLQDQPRNARAWYLLSQVMPTWEERIACLEKVLEIDPKNFQARVRMERYRARAMIGPTKRASRTRLVLIIVLVSAVALLALCVLVWGQALF